MLVIRLALSLVSKRTIRKNASMGQPNLFKISACPSRWVVPSSATASASTALVNLELSTVVDVQRQEMLIILASVPNPISSASPCQTATAALRVQVRATMCSLHSIAWTHMNQWSMERVEPQQEVTSAIYVPAQIIARLKPFTLSARLV